MAPRRTTSPRAFAPQIADIAEDAWRMRLWNYAYRASGGEWVPYRALKYIADIIQATIARGGGRLIINIPPRHGKSELISRWLPTWFLDWYPHKNVILTSYGDSLAANYGRKVRDELQGNELTWTELGNKQLVTDWRTAHGGGMRTAGVGGPILGFGSDLFLIDDPYKNKAEAFNETYRERLKEWFNSTAYSRLEPNATVILIMQRWHHEDLSGYLMNEHEDDWVQVRLPALAETDEEEGIVDPLGRAAGESLVPERYNEETLGKIKRAVGSVFWSGMYQQRPSPAEGNIILRDWMEYYMRYPPNIRRVVVSWDMSFKKTGKSWCVGQAWYQKGSQHWMLDQERFKAGFTEALQRMVRFHNSCTGRWANVHETLIEEAANGIGIIDTVRGKMPRVKGVKATTSKIERLSNAAPSIECGDVLLPDKRIATFDVEGLVDELVAFPNGPDDQCDSLSQYINKYKTQKVGQIVIPEVGVGPSSWPT